MIRLVVALALLGLTGVNAWAAQSVAVFPFELIDDSQEGEADGLRADQTARLKAITAQLNDALKAEGRYAVVDMKPVEAEIADKAPLHKCNDCERDIAKKVGAELAMVGVVQKVSNLILNMNLYIRDVASGQMKRTMSVDIRGNTDESWSRSLAYLLKNQLFAQEKASQ